jgi:FdrA protein
MSRAAEEHREAEGRHEVEVRRGSYYDSVSLMQVSRTVAGVEGVAAALVAMATELNLDLLTGMGFTPPADASPNDLVLAVRAEDDAALERARAAADATLASIGRGGGGAGGGASLSAGELPPRTIAAAARRGTAGTAGTAGVAVISVPGQHAFVEAMDALEAGLSVLLFSDNVPVEQEIRLKEEAARRDLLVMGPDCGTAVVSGVGLGFANVVRPGPVGLVAASGTGAQQLLCLLDAAGVGVTHCLGVGGRDLSAAVAGRSTMQSMAALDQDPGTEVIVVVSKPPAEQIARHVTAWAAELSTPVIWALLGRDAPDLTACARQVVEAVGASWTAPRWWPAPAERTGTYPSIRGLFSGGTLCDEAMVVASAALGPVWSNIALEPDWMLGADLRHGGHVMIDFGDDALTQGGLHPMIDQRSRLDRIAVEAADPTAGVLLLDVVLGHGAHPDPAAELGPALAAAHATAASDGRDLAVVISLSGTESDPQGLIRQAEALRDVGASVHLSNATAARKAVELVSEATP